MYRALTGNGDLGVDIFFVISGFLIAHILLKECAKYEGKIDIWNFFRSRFIRIWPALVGYLLFELYKEVTKEDEKDKTTVTDHVLFAFFKAFFATNFYGKMSHTWSLAVEFQMYLISPFIVMGMYKSQRPWVYPLGILVVSTAINYIVIYRECGMNVLYDNANWEGCGEQTWLKIYQ
jgi:peptidoglycan/LPS O-acetylase OafA/YrhL